MRSTFAVLPLLFVATTLAGDELCGTSEANDARVRALHERAVARERVASNAVEAPAVLRDGSFFVQADDTNTPGYHPFDLEGQSLVFAPRAQSKFAVTREASRYVEPAGEPLYDFESRTNTPWHSVAYDLKNFAMPLFGQSVTRVYISAFNGIHLAPPAEVGAMQFDKAEAATHRAAVLSPLLITTRKPTRLHYPKLYVDDGADAVRFTWRSESGASFGYDVQAELRSDGRVVYSYKSTREMRWGTPILTAGFNPSTALERSLGGGIDASNDLAAGTSTTYGPMVDIRNVDLVRVDESELFAVRFQTAAPIGQITGDTKLRFIVEVGGYYAYLDLDSTGYSVIAFTGARAEANGATARVDGNTVWLYGAHVAPNDQTGKDIRIWSYVLPSTRVVDFFDRNMILPPPAKRIATDLSAAAGSELSLPITEPFVLGGFDPFSVWEKLQHQFALSDAAIDAVAMYQTFYTDLIFYAGAYATGGNAGVDGIWTANQSQGTRAPRAPTLLHMNQVAYGYNAAEQTASKVMLHEFGHRWLYFFRIKEGNSTTRSLNPVSAHPAGYVHTPSAFKVYEDEESSVMGGGYFSDTGAGSYRARALNYGYSWTDLYLMGLASTSEVAPWFYLANTNPPLAQEYWPTDNATVTGEKRDVIVDQILAVHGPRNPSAAMSQKLFRVLYVLVTENGAEPTSEEIAKLNEWRALMEKNFSIATGGRGRVETNWVPLTKRRATR